MRYLFLILLLMIYGRLVAQEQELQNWQQLEDIAETEETESEDDYNQQQLAHLKDHPLNINDSSAMQDFPLLNTLQLVHLAQYRRLLGNLESIYELQAVPGFTLELIKTILPYVTISPEKLTSKGFLKRFDGGKLNLLVTPSFTPQKAAGFIGAGSDRDFAGSRPRILFRYTYRYADVLQYGLVGDKDPGEPFELGKKQYGFDFYSFHLFARKMGIIKSLALGDYTINLGQGLIHWQSQAFKKSSGVINIKRQGEVLRPYHSAGEYNFHRGVAVSLQKNRWQSTVFVSCRKISANISYDEEQGEVIRSVLMSGFNRTVNEREDKNSARMLAAGGNIRFAISRLLLSFNSIHYHYSLPLMKEEEAYNIFSVKGKHWSNSSADYSYTFRNCHFFGEAAIDKSGHPAFINGVMASLDNKVDIAMVYRNISMAYQSLYGNAFTENTMPSNERGWYMGLSGQPHPRWKLDMYADFFSFPWLKYRVNAPGGGIQYLAQLSWKPGKQVEVYSRFRTRIKPLNTSGLPGNILFPDDRLMKNWRTHISFQVTRNILLRSRTELCWFYRPGSDIAETGFLFYTDLVYKPFGKWYSGNVRFQAFESDGYDTRLYAYENDVLFSNSIPSFFDSGQRCYVNLKGKVHLNFLHKGKAEIAFRAAHTIYRGKSVIGSGSDQISGNGKSELKFQLFLYP